MHELLLAIGIFILAAFFLMLGICRGNRLKDILAFLLLLLLALPAGADSVTRQGTRMEPVQMAMLRQGAPSSSTILTNVTQSSVTNASFLISIGAVVNNNATAAGNLENRIEIGFVLPTTARDIFLFGAIQNAATSGVIDLESGGAGFRKVLGNNGEIYAKLGGEHASSSHAWAAAAGFGVSYAPLASPTSTSFLSASSLYCEEWAVHNFGGSTPDYLRTVAGVRFNF